MGEWGPGQARPGPELWHVENWISGVPCHLLAASASAVSPQALLKQLGLASLPAAKGVWRSGLSPPPPPPMHCPLVEEWGPY